MPINDFNSMNTNQMSSNPGAQSAYAPRRRGGKWVWIILLVLVLAGGCYVYRTYFGPVDRETYQAVFIQNGQVYFGQLTYSGKWLTLEDVYYLEAREVLQAEEGVPPAQDNIQLVKLGGELHGPTDEMFIAKSNVLFWENMKADSKVMEAIRAHKAGLE